MASKLTIAGNGLDITAIQTAAARMMFSMSRDRVLPGHGVLGRVSPVTGTPVLPAGTLSSWPI